MTDTLPDDAKALLLTMRLTLLTWQPATLGKLPDDGTREKMRAGTLQMLGAIEDALELPRTVPPRPKRLQGVVD